MNTNKAVTAVFTATTQYTLTVNTQGSGTVTPPSGSTYNPGVVVQLEATPQAGWAFDHWEGDLTGNVNPTQITMNTNKVVTAVFTATGPVTYNLSVQIDGDGHVNPSASGPFVPGTVVTLTAIANANSTFVNWTGDVNSSLSVVQVTMDSDKSVTAHFRANSTPPGGGNNQTNFIPGGGGGVFVVSGAAAGEGLSELHNFASTPSEQASTSAASGTAKMWWHGDDFSRLQSGGSAFISMIFGDRSKFLASMSSPQSIPADIGTKIALAFVPKAKDSKVTDKKEPEMLSKLTSGEKKSAVSDEDSKEKSNISWYQKLKDLLASVSGRFLSAMNRG